MGGGHADKNQFGHCRFRDRRHAWVALRFAAFDLGGLAGWANTAWIDPRNIGAHHCRPAGVILDRPHDGQDS